MSRGATPDGGSRGVLGGARLLRTPTEQRNRYALRKEPIRIKPKTADDIGWHETLRYSIGEDWVAPENPLFQGVDIELDGDMSVTQQLMEALSENMTRVVELFKSWDENLDGRITKKEFRRAMKVLMKKVETPVVD